MNRILAKFRHMFLRAALASIIAGACTATVAADLVDLGEYTLDHKQLKDAVYGRGFNIGLNEKAIDKLMEIQQFLQAGRWVKAFRIIDADRQLWAGKQVPRQDGFTLPVDEFLARLVASLPAEAREAFETYFSARAKQLLAQANTLAPAEEIKELRRLQAYYSLTPAGSESANRLGDAYFEQGRFRQAAFAWETLVRDQTLDLDFEKRVYAKLAIAYFRSSNAEKLALTLEVLNRRFSGESFKFGAESLSADEFIAKFDSIKPKSRDSNQSNAAVAARLPRKNAKPVWSVDWLTDQRKSGQPAAIPDVRLVGDRVYVNHGWATASYLLKNGETAWLSGLERRQGSLLNLVKRVAQQQIGVPVADPSQAQIGPAERQQATLNDLTVVQRIDQKKVTTLQAFHTSSGKLAWTTSENQEFKLTGNIVAFNESIVAAAYSTTSQNELHLLFYDSDGNLDSSQRLGTVVGISNPYYGNSVQPSPVLVAYDQYVLVMPNDGAVIAIDPESEGKIEWIYQFSPARKTAEQGAMVFWSGMPRPKTYIRPSAVVHDGIFYFRDDEDHILHALDPGKRKVLWARPMNRDAQILGVDNRFVFVLTKEFDNAHTLQMIDRDTHELVFCPRLPEMVSPEFVVGDETVLVS
ncbi:MAG: PQQ-like beta-propeller repeat protein, partial [Planctomycetales bacterium]|nr:PQQ-like beta-propeller repeat protein [Planctomycetales bacterium]